MGENKKQAKKMETEHGVQIGDIFIRNAFDEDSGSYVFYQVVSLRGKTQVAVRRIDQAVIAFDGFHHDGVVPIKDSWVDDEVLFRKVHCYEDYRSITVGYGLRGNAYLDAKEIYITYGMSAFTRVLCKFHPDIADQLDLEQGFGVYAVDRPFKSIADNCRAVIRYPNGEQQEVILSELLCWEEVLRRREQQMKVNVLEESR